jgi:iron complex outermembrane receptor protein
MRWRLVAAAVIARVKAPPPKGALHGLWAAPIAWLMASSVVAAQENPNPAGSSSTTTLPEIRVIATTPVAPPRVTPRAAAAPAAVRPAPAPEAAPKPVPGAVEQDKIPSNVQTVGASAFDYTRAPDLLQSMVQALPGVALSSQAGNEFQLDFNYRGYVASPVIGTPQGLAVYQNGARINEVFGDVVNWDLIPQSAINRLTLVPSNPVYGLNATGGALAFEMKNGYTYHAIEGEVNGGSYGRAVASVQAGGEVGNLSGYITADAIDDAGWRMDTPSSLRRVFADLGARGDQTEFHVSFTGANNNFSANPATPVQMLAQNWSSTYTLPQTT